jgi:hypothetical protein
MNTVLGYALPKQTMEMTEYGKHGKPRSRLSTLPTLLGYPFGITTFPSLDNEIRDLEATAKTQH